jgi:Rrf2 family protein
LKLSHATIYALHALVHLASQPPNRLVPSHLIAEGRGIPGLFLLKVLKQLALAGVLHSLKGPHGGYRLARKPRDISLLEVVEAVDGPLQGQAPFESDGASRLDDRLQDVCRQAAEAVRRQFQRVRLADLVTKR